MNKELVYFGKIVNTHGIKGELRILSDFEKKELVLKPNFPLYIGEEQTKEKITSYRHHKMFEMVCLEGYSNINEVLKYVGKKVYVSRNDLQLTEEEYLYEDLLNMQVYENEELLGSVVDVIFNGINNLLLIKGTKDFYIPINKEFIKQVNKEQKRIEVANAKGLML